MRILFLENKQQTLFWEEVAARLQQNGDEIFWIVQNAGFTPDVGFQHVIPYPNGNGHMRSIQSDAEIQRIVSTDRGINYFGGDASHYDYYEREISRILDVVKPDVVFGEATLFHELLCVRQCRMRKILYLNPTSCRYPSGRFSFYLYDTPKPFLGSGEEYSEQEATSLAEKIARREIQPDYMNGRPHAWAVRAYETLRKNLQVTTCCFSGERYNTPSPISKIALELGQRMNRLRWERLSARPVSKNVALKILYPLQLQPENNIDLWGNGYRDQTKLLAGLLRATDENSLLVVKPNPKSKYELSDELLDLVGSSDRILVVPHRMSMGEVLKTIDLIVTVTGTIAIEATFADRPVVTLVETLHNSVPSCIHGRDLNNLSHVVRMVREGSFPRATAAQKVAFLNLLTKTSYAGIISNPYSCPSCVSDENVRQVRSAFGHVLDKIRSNPTVGHTAETSSRFS